MNVVERMAQGWQWPVISFIMLIGVPGLWASGRLLAKQHSHVKKKHSHQIPASLAELNLQLTV